MVAATFLFAAVAIALTVKTKDTSGEESVATEWTPPPADPSPVTPRPKNTSQPSSSSPDRAATGKPVLTAAVQSQLSELREDLGTINTELRQELTNAAIELSSRQSRSETVLENLGRQKQTLTGRADSARGDLARFEADLRDIERDRNPTVSYIQAYREFVDMWDYLGTSSAAVNEAQQAADEAHEKLRDAQMVLADLNAELEITEPELIPSAKVAVDMATADLNRARENFKEAEEALVEAHRAHHANQSSVNGQSGDLEQLMEAVEWADPSLQELRTSLDEYTETAVEVANARRSLAQARAESKDFQQRSERSTTFGSQVRHYENTRVAYLRAQQVHREAQRQVNEAQVAVDRANRPGQDAVRRQARAARDRAIERRGQAFNAMREATAAMNSAKKPITDFLREVRRLNIKITQQQRYKQTTLEALRERALAVLEEMDRVYKLLEPTERDRMEAEMRARERVQNGRARLKEAEEELAGVETGYIRAMEERDHATEALRSIELLQGLVADGTVFKKLDQLVEVADEPHESTVSGSIRALAAAIHAEPTRFRNVAPEVDKLVAKRRQLLVRIRSLL